MGDQVEMKIFIGVCNLIIPIIMIIFGVISIRDVPKNINTFAGYRTERSMKNIDTWRFANRYCGALWKELGIGLFIISLICTCISFLYSIEFQCILSLVLIVIQILMIIFSIYLVEKELKNTFDENGHYKQK